jgi:hypothetical protein
MDIVIACLFFVVGLGLIIVSAEQLVKGAVGTSVSFGGLDLPDQCCLHWL